MAGSTRAGIRYGLEHSTLCKIQRIAGMPVYDYFCKHNGRTVELTHPVGASLRMWGEVCYVAQIPLGDTPAEAPVERIITSAPAINVSLSNAELKNAGFTKLVRRDDGVYENVTAARDEERIVTADGPGPHGKRRN